MLSKYIPISNHNFVYFYHNFICQLYFNKAKKNEDDI